MDCAAQSRLLTSRARRHGLRRPRAGSTRLSPEVVMDGSHFDDLTRALAISRRGALKHLLAGLVAGAGGLLGAGMAAGQGCEPVRRRCVADTDCCSGLCDPATGRCVCAAGTEECSGDCIPLDQYQSDAENCGGCRVRCRHSPECQLPACLAGVCGGVPDPDQIGQPCRHEPGVCGADGVCACPPELPAACRHDCVDTTSDPDNCGACDIRCRGTAHGMAVCAGGVCSITCDAGYALCGDRCCADGRECCGDDCCGPNQCCAAEGCVPCFCSIGIDRYENRELNPDNACQYCDPTRNTNDWTTLSDGTFCGDGRVCCNGECCSPSECCDGVQCTNVNCPDQCEIQGIPYEDDQINPAHDCQKCDADLNRFDWTLVDDNAPCGTTPGRVCCNGECCSPTECCGATSCEECGPHCRIGDEDIDEGEVNPSDPCQVCKPEVNPAGWSTADDGTDCSGNIDEDRVCCAGACCPDGQCCNDGACGDCRCLISGIDWAADARNPLNHCEICKPDRDPEHWSPAPNGPGCGAGDERECCEGVCCPQGECCNDIGECERCPCHIDGHDVVDGGVNPANTCQICNVDENREDWTVLPDDAACGTDTDDRDCCAGVCCPQGQCCEGGSCQDCGCTIEGTDIDPATINEANPCQICDPSRARLDWSPVDNGTSCGPDGAECCGGECCAGDQCCLLDACGECLCSIDGINYPADTHNEANPCQVCKPDKLPFEWSPVADDTSCGDDQVCCSGHCCEVGECCNLGICQFCGCKIGEDEVAEFAVNPENECEWCDPVLDPFAWSHRSDEPCGVDQVCCGGVCCEFRHCCGLDNACVPCPCQIGDQTIEAGTFNPDNSCQVCDPERDPEDWSPVLDNESCGDGSGNVCCDGVCCPSGECCHALNVCGPEPCQCTIGDLTVNEGTRNPDNACEMCWPYTSTSGWTPRDDNTNCETVFDPKARFCCQGVCCEVDLCCRSDNTCGECVCTIDDIEYGPGHRNPENDCQFCDPDQNKDGWTVGNDHLACGENSDQFCCAGACCPAGECCHSLEGTCGAEPCSCAITEGNATITYPEGTINLENRCEVCDPSESATGWSPRPDLVDCSGAPGPKSGHCCQGVCCDNASENCCLSNGTCGTCVCTIDDQEFAAAVSNPANNCQVCIPYENHTGWTTLDNGTGCGATLEQVCCSGICCQTGQCCNGESGVCESCGCEIEAVFYGAGTSKPDNDCEICDPSVSATSWSPAPDHAHCGDQQVCCNGACCPGGECCRTGFSFCSIEWCGLTDPCDYVDPCGCTIDGVFYPHETVNPGNECQWCHAYFSTTSWSSRGDFAGCGPNEDRYCCNDICCELGACCHDADACEFGSPYCKGCVITGRFYRHLQRNPNNPCELCNADLDPAFWSNRENHQHCGPMIDDDGIYWGDLLCCEGVCCTDWYNCCRADGTCGQGPCPDW